MSSNQPGSVVAIQDELPKLIRMLREPAGDDPRFGSLRVNQSKSAVNFREKCTSRRKPCPKNRVEEHIEKAVLEIALDKPAFGQVRVANELTKRGLFVSPTGVRSVWLRHDLETFRKRLKALEAKAAQEHLVLTEEQLRALERSREEKEAHGDRVQSDTAAFRQVLLWEDADVDLLGFAFLGAGEDARLYHVLRAGAGAEPCAAERRRRRGCGRGRLINLSVRSSVSYYS